jgi:hypothetical protein
VGEMTWNGGGPQQALPRPPSALLPPPLPTGERRRWAGRAGGRWWGASCLANTVASGGAWATKALYTPRRRNARQGIGQWAGSRGAERPLVPTPWLEVRANPKR